MDHPLVTVITPAFDIEAFLAEAVESVLAQTERDFEYLIVDDGSTDRTLEIAQNYAARDPRIRVLRGAHRGSSAARNIGLREARGEFIAFCDGDDRWTPEFLATSLAVLRSAPASVGATFSAYSLIDHAGRPMGQRCAPLGDYDAEQVLAGNCPQGNGSCLLIRASCFEEAGLFDEGLFNCVDLDMWLRIGISSSTPLFRLVPEPLVAWRVRPGAISASHTARVDGLDVIFQRYAYLLGPGSRARAYTWPAVLAFLCGRDTIGRQWGTEVRSADRRYWLRGKDGFRLTLFLLLGPARARALLTSARPLVIRARGLLPRARGYRSARLHQPS